MRVVRTRGSVKATYWAIAITLAPVFAAVVVDDVFGISPVFGGDDSPGAHIFGASLAAFLAAAGMLWVALAKRGIGKKPGGQD